jgi:hypothetical protein
VAPVTGADANHPRTQVEKPVEEALELRLVSECSAQYGVSGFAAKRKTFECQRVALANFTFENDLSRKVRHMARVLVIRRLCIALSDVHPGERRVPPTD